MSKQTKQSNKAVLAMLLTILLFIAKIVWMEKKNAVEQHTEKITIVYVFFPPNSEMYPSGIR